MKTVITPSDVAPITPGLHRATSLESGAAPIGRAIGSIFIPIPLATNTEGTAFMPPSNDIASPTKPAPGAAHLPKLTPEELAMCERLGVKPEDFAAAKAETEAKDKSAKAGTEEAANAERRHGLSAAELDMCERTGVTPDAYARARTN